MDFSDLVLAPNMNVFAMPVTVTPVASLPNAIPYPARGIWMIASSSIVTEAGGVLSTFALKFSIRMSEYATPPKQGDWITTLASNLPLAYWQGVIDPTSSIDFEVDTFTPDGQGGATLTVDRVVQ